jgi:hypothetical protein
MVFLSHYYLHSVLGSQGILYGMCSVKRLGVANFLSEMARRHWIVHDTLPGTNTPHLDHHLTLDLDTTQRVFYCHRSTQTLATSSTHQQPHTDIPATGAMSARATPTVT